MVNLKSCEILDELRKLGIEIPSDIMDYLKDYTDYLSDQDQRSGPESAED
ncbi:MAG: hypothetical protein HZA16_05095 [Nitrospirae bacterium]|nr:hypothetical protein [Nitrospirota bacterium]